MPDITASDSNQRIANFGSLRDCRLLKLHRIIVRTKSFPLVTNMGKVCDLFVFSISSTTIFFVGASLITYSVFAGLFSCSGFRKRGVRWGCKPSSLSRWRISCLYSHSSFLSYKDMHVITREKAFWKWTFLNCFKYDECLFPWSLCRFLDHNELTTLSAGVFNNLPDLSYL